MQVWLTKDERLVVLHGGDDGEMAAAESESSKSPKYVFDMTFDEIVAQQASEFIEIPDGKSSVFELS